ncbi:hypothetical protein CN645_06360 [Burkholderia sp. IDO3]|nr:hypothetical protein DCN14_00500 [Burkholderia sp. IDO3]PCD62847.1 hypothetical protein CN645_06360 [Burkholderia sp. IDO3]
MIIGAGIKHGLILTLRVSEAGFSFACFLGVFEVHAMVGMLGFAMLAVGFVLARLGTDLGRWCFMVRRWRRSVRHGCMPKNHLAHS